MKAKSTRIVTFFMKCWVLVVTLFLLIDLISSFTGIYTLFPPNAPFIFKAAVSAGISVSAVAMNGVGKIFRVLARQGYSVQIWSVKSSYQAVPVTSPVVAWCVTIIPPLLAAFDWFTSFIGTCIIFSGFGIENMDNIWTIFSWFMGLFSTNIIAAFAIVITTVLSSCSPFLLLQLGESEKYVKSMADALEKKRQQDEQKFRDSQITPDPV